MTLRSRICAFKIKTESINYCVLIKVQLDLKMNSKEIDAIIITLINHDINMLIELDIPKEISSELNIVKNIVIEFNWL